MTETEIELELDEEVIEFLEQDGIDADRIINGLLELQRAKQMWDGEQE